MSSKELKKIYITNLNAETKRRLQQKAGKQSLRGYIRLLIQKFIRQNGVTPNLRYKQKVKEVENVIEENNKAWEIFYNKHY